MNLKRLIALGLAMVIGSAQISTVCADELEDMQNQVAETEAAQSEIYDAIDTMATEQAVVNEQIEDTDNELVMTIASINILDEQIGETSSQLETTTENLKKAEEKKAVQYDAMKKRIQYLYEKGGDVGWAVLLLEGENITGVLNKAEYTQKMYKYDRESLQEYSATVTEVSDLQTELTGEKAELEAMKNEQESQKETLNGILDELQATSEDYEAAIADAEYQAALYQESINEQNEAIAEYLEEQERQRIAAEEAAAEAAAAAAAAYVITSDNSEEADEAATAAAEEAAAEIDDEDMAQEIYDQVYYETYQETYEEVTEEVYEEGEDYEGSDDSGEESYSAPASSTGAAAADYACQFIGNPYVWGGTSLTNGADCSGFTMSVYAAFGVSLPHSSASQASCGVGVSFAEAQPGDLICYSGHVAIYLGDNMIVHASDEATGIKISYNAAYRPIVAVRRVA